MYQDYNTIGIQSSIIENIFGIGEYPPCIKECVKIITQLEYIL